MGQRVALALVLSLGILFFGSTFEENFSQIIEAQATTTLELIKISSEEDTFDFTVSGPSSYNPSITTISNELLPDGEIVIQNGLELIYTNGFEIDFSSEYSTDSIIGQEVTFSNQIPTKIRIDNLKFTDFPNNDAALQFRIYSNYTLDVTEFKDLVLEASSDIFFANSTDYEALGDNLVIQFNFTSAPSLDGTYAVSLVFTNPNWQQGIEEQVFVVLEGDDFIPGDCFSLENINDPFSIITRESGGQATINCEDFPFKVYVKTTTNPRILWDDFGESYFNRMESNSVFGTEGNGDNYILGNRVNLTSSSILSVSIPGFSCSFAQDGTLVAKIFENPTVGSTIIPPVLATSDTWSVLSNADGDCNFGNPDQEPLRDITFNFTGAPELTGQYFIGIEVDNFVEIIGISAFDKIRLAHPSAPYDPIVFMGYNATDGWIDQLINENDGEILSIRMAVLQNQAANSVEISGVDGPTEIDPGTYSISETIPVGWTLTNAACNDGVSTFSVDTVSGIAVGSGDNITCIFSNEITTSDDSDSDGIFDEVDTLPNTSSNDFSDVGIGGTSFGTITSRGQQTLTVTEEPNPNGVRIVADLSGGLIPATINTCGGLAILNLNAGDDVVVTCSSVIIDVTNGPVEVTFISSEGVEATASIPTGNSITFNQDLFSFVAPSTNTESISIDVDGSILSISPGETSTSPPVVGAISISQDPLQVNTLVDASATFTDLGPFETHTALWDWGDSTTSAGTVTEDGLSGTVTGSHIYSVPGVYTVTLTVTDDNGDSGSSLFQFVVIYNPEGGFVTGGGWIDSPQGAYVLDSSFVGKATFGFVSKYQNGANIPTGNTQFSFKVADLKFKSTEYDWLVVAGSNAKFKGTGTINGQGNYGFQLFGFDADINTNDNKFDDKFRIKIWDKNNGDTVVYDNNIGEAEDSEPSTILGGGSIVIHNP